MVIPKTPIPKKIPPIRINIIVVVAMPNPKPIAALINCVMTKTPYLSTNDQKTPFMLLNHFFQYSVQVK